MKMAAGKGQTVIGITGADTPNYILETSLTEAFPNSADAVVYNELLPEEDDDNDILWYPLRVRHSNPKKVFRVRDKLREKGLTTYLRLEQREAIINGELQDVSVPVLSNLIFVHNNKKVIRYLKNTERELSSLQFISKPKKVATDKAVIITVPDKQMMQFIQTETLPDPNKQRVQLDYKAYIDKAGRRVKIIRGPFLGVEGEVKHIRGNRVIVVKLKELGLAVGIAYVKPEDMKFID